MQVRSQEGSQSEMEPRTSSSGSGSHEVGIGDAEPVSGDLHCGRLILQG